MLKDYSVDAKSGEKPEYLVIFFHGYGSGGQQMADYVGGLLGEKLPEAKLRFPEGPIELHRDDEGHSYHSWFDIQDMVGDGKRPDPDKIGPRAAQAAEDINAYIDKVIAEEGVSPDKVILAGFSQGATMAYYAGLLRDDPVAGVYSLSGGALDRLADPKSKPPVGLVAGGEEHSDYSGNIHAQKVVKELDEAGFLTQCVLVPGKKHEISPESMDLLAAFTRIVTKPAADNDNTADQTARPRRRHGGPKP